MTGTKLHDRSCETVSQSLKTIKKLLQDLGRVIDGEKVDQSAALSLKSDIENKIEAIYEKIGPETFFMDQIRDEEKWKRVFECFAQPPNIYELREYKKMFSLFCYFSSEIELTDRSISNFWRLFLSDPFIIKKKKQLFAKRKGSYREGDETRLNAFFQALFVNKFIKDDTILNFSDFPKEFSKFVGAYLGRGTLIADKVDTGCGHRATGGSICVNTAAQFAGDYATNLNLKIDEAFGMNGSLWQKGKLKIGKHTERGLGYRQKSGFIQVDTAQDNLVEAMTGGVLLCKKAGDNLGTSASGGVIICDDAGRNIGDYSKSSTPETATFLLKKYESISSDCRAQVFMYEENGIYNQWDNVRGPGYWHIVVPLISGSHDDDFKKDGSGLYIVRKGISSESLGENYISDLLDGLKGGIVVLRESEIPKNLGQGMIDGAVIIENYLVQSKEGLTELKNKICKEREGGVILARVVDPEDPKKTILIDLEDFDE